MQDPWFLMNNKISSDNIYPVRITSYDMLYMPVLRNACPRLLHNLTATTYTFRETETQIKQSYKSTKRQIYYLKPLI